MSSANYPNYGTITGSAYPVVNNRTNTSANNRTNTGRKLTTANYTDPKSKPGQPMGKPGTVTNPIYDPNSTLTSAQEAKDRELTRVLKFREQEEREKEETARATAEAISNASAKKYLALAFGIMLVIGGFILFWVFYLSKKTKSGIDAGKSSDGSGDGIDSFGNSSNQYGKCSK